MQGEEPLTEYRRITIRLQLQRGFERYTYQQKHWFHLAKSSFHSCNMFRGSVHGAFSHLPVVLSIHADVICLDFDTSIRFSSCHQPKTMEENGILFGVSRKISTSKTNRGNSAQILSYLLSSKSTHEARIINFDDDLQTLLELVPPDIENPSVCPHVLVTTI